MNKQLLKNFPLLLLLILLFPALFINLGVPSITADEPTRAIVAMEMEYAGNYLISTIAGEYYYKKPPLFNWILVALYETTGSRSEFITRIAAVIPLLLFALRIFILLKHYVGRETALLTALFFLTFGRMLFYDSMLGHIDILYAWLTFESFMLLYRYQEKGKYLQMFLYFYLLHAAGFMLKGLPSLLFPVLTLGAMAFHQKQYRWLFTWQHVLAVVVAGALPFLFFFEYAKVNSPEGWILQLWDQSKQRTVLDKTWWESIRHLFIFPLDHLMHLAPWSLLLPFLFAKGFKKQAQANPFLSYLFWVLVFNIPVYWASPGYYPRYLFMLYPILFVFIADAFVTQTEKEKSRYISLFNRVTIILMIVLTAAFAGAMVMMKWDILSPSFLIILLLMVCCVLMAFKLKQQLMYSFICFILVTRIAFDVYIIPYREFTGIGGYYRKEALKIAALTKGKPLYLTYPITPLSHHHIYYIERERGEALTYHKPDTQAYFIYEPGSLPPVKLDTIHTFRIEYKNLEILLVKFAEVPPLPEKELSMQR